MRRRQLGDGDGCSAACEVECGFACEKKSEGLRIFSTCTRHCGDGVVQWELGEECDDTSKCCDGCRLAPSHNAECSGACCDADCKIPPNGGACTAADGASAGVCVGAECVAGFPLVDEVAGLVFDPVACPLSAAEPCKQVGSLGDECVRLHGYNLADGSVCAQPGSGRRALRVGRVHRRRALRRRPRRPRRGVRRRVGVLRGCQLADGAECSGDGECCDGSTCRYKRAPASCDGAGTGGADGVCVDGACLPAALSWCGVKTPPLDVYCAATEAEPCRIACPADGSCAAPATPADFGLDDAIGYLPEGTACETGGVVGLCSATGTCETGDGGWYCGDGHVAPGEECDLGAANGDTACCTKKCTLNRAKAAACAGGECCTPECHFEPPTHSCTDGDVHGYCASGACVDSSPFCHAMRGELNTERCPIAADEQCLEACAVVDGGALSCRSVLSTSSTDLLLNLDSFVAAGAGFVADGTSCALPDATSGVCKTGVCVHLQACGNGHVDAGEECDDDSKCCDNCKLRVMVKDDGTGWERAQCSFMHGSEPNDCCDQSCQMRPTSHICTDMTQASHDACPHLPDDAWASAELHGFCNAGVCQPCSASRRRATGHQPLRDGGRAVQAQPAVDQPVRDEGLRPRQLGGVRGVGRRTSGPSSTARRTSRRRSSRGAATTCRTACAAPASATTGSSAWCTAASPSCRPRRRRLPPPPPPPPAATSTSPAPSRRARRRPTRRARRSSSACRTRSNGSRQASATRRTRATTRQPPPTSTSAASAAASSSPTTT